MCNKSVKCMSCGTVRSISKTYCPLCTERAILKTISTSSKNELTCGIVGAFIGMLLASPVAHSFLGMDEFNLILAMISFVPGMIVGAFIGSLFGTILDI